jgi:hypothetical protein
LYSPVPSVKVAKEYPVPLPINNCPFDGVVESPVPPLDISKIPLELANLP